MDGVQCRKPMELMEYHQVKQYVSCRNSRRSRKRDDVESLFKEIKTKKLPKFWRRE
jgi:hypothetical protein